MKPRKGKCKVLSKSSVYKEYSFFTYQDDIFIFTTNEFNLMVWGGRMSLSNLLWIDCINWSNCSGQLLYQLHILLLRLLDTASAVSYAAWRLSFILVQSLCCCQLYQCVFLLISVFYRKFVPCVNYLIMWGSVRGVCFPNNLSSICSCYSSTRDLVIIVDDVFNTVR